MSAAVAILEDESHSLGLTLNKAKCQVWVGDFDSRNADPLGCNIPRASCDGFTLLGSPIGLPAFMAAQLNHRIDKIEDTLVNKIPQLEDPQVQLCLTRSTQSIVKFIYSMRTCDPLSIQPCLQRFDRIQSSALESIIGAALTPQAVQQASLPVSKGGLGLRKASSHCFAAFLSSTAQTTHIVDGILHNFPHRRSLQETLDDFLTTAGPIPQSAEDDLKTMDPVHFTQSKLSHLVDTNIQADLLSHATQASDKRTTARLQSLTLAHASDYLNSIPSHTSGLSLLPQSFRFALLYRLGLPIYPTPDPHCPACGNQMDQYGDHTITCATENERICRHDALRDIIFETANHAGLFPKKEARSLVPDSQRRPGDVYIPTWRHRPHAFDVAVTSPLCASNLPQSSTTTGSALEKMKVVKNNKHFHQCRRQGIVFVPLVVETLGGWDPEAVFHLKSIAEKTAHRSNQRPTFVVKHFFQRLSVILQRANSSLIATRAPPPPPPHVTGYE